MENSYVKVSVSCINQSIKKVNEQLYDHDTNLLNFVWKENFVNLYGDVTHFLKQISNEVTGLILAHSMQYLYLDRWRPFVIYRWMSIEYDLKNKEIHVIDQDKFNCLIYKMK